MIVISVLRWFTGFPLDCKCHLLMACFHTRLLCLLRSDFLPLTILKQLLLLASIAYNMFNIFSFPLQVLSDRQFFEKGKQYLCLINSNTYLCNDFYSISLYPSIVFYINQLQQLAMALAIYSCMEEALHQVRYLKAFDHYV